MYVVVSIDIELRINRIDCYRVVQYAKFRAAATSWPLTLQHCRVQGLGVWGIGLWGVRARGPKGFRGYFHLSPQCQRHAC